jgi:hypothetical protein
MKILVENTNKSGLSCEMCLRNARALEWKDISVPELYECLGILLYMGLHLQHDIDQY